MSGSSQITVSYCRCIVCWLWDWFFHSKLHSILQSTLQSAWQSTRYSSRYWLLLHGLWRRCLDSFSFTGYCLFFPIRIDPSSQCSSLVTSSMLSMLSALSIDPVSCVNSIDATRLVSWWWGFAMSLFFLLPPANALLSFLLPPIQLFFLLLTTRVVLFFDPHCPWCFYSCRRRYWFSCLLVLCWHTRRLLDSCRAWY